jgi:hypothetical protein
MLCVNLDDLQAELDRLGVDRSHYSLRGGRPEGGFAIKREGRRWIVYYSERGGRSGIEKHDSLDAACRRLLQLLIGQDGPPSQDPGDRP